MSASTSTSRGRSRSARPACHGHAFRQYGKIRDETPASISALPGPVVTKHKMAQHITITDTTVGRNQPGIGAGAGPDGTCVRHTTVPAGDLDTATVVTAYKNQATSNATSRPSRPLLPPTRSWRQSGTARPRKGVPDDQRGSRTRTPAEAPTGRAEAEP